jgi:hypothetical protein
MSLVLQSSGGGSVTLEEPTTASNFTQTLPAADGTIAVADGSGNLSVTGNLSFNSGYGSSAVAYGCRAWVNFNGTGTPAIRASGNVSSITDSGTGAYRINFSTAMPDDDFAATGASGVSQTDPSFRVDTMNVSYVDIMTLRTSTNANYDDAQVSVIVFR